MDLDELEAAGRMVQMEEEAAKANAEDRKKKKSNAELLCKGISSLTIAKKDTSDSDSDTSDSEDDSSSSEDDDSSSSESDLDSDDLSDNESNITAV